MSYTEKKRVQGRGGSADQWNMENEWDEGGHDGRGLWVVVGVLLGLAAALCGLVIGSPSAFCAGPLLVAYTLLGIPRIRPAAAGALLPAVGLVAVAVIFH